MMCVKIFQKNTMLIFIAVLVQICSGYEITTWYESPDLPTFLLFPFTESLSVPPSQSTHVVCIVNNASLDNVSFILYRVNNDNIKEKLEESGPYSVDAQGTMNVLTLAGYRGTGRYGVYGCQLSDRETEEVLAVKEFTILDGDFSFQTKGIGLSSFIGASGFIKCGNLSRPNNYPGLSFTWRREDKKAINGNKSANIIFFENLKSEDDGYYYCIASSDGQASVIDRIRVQVTIPSKDDLSLGGDSCKIWTAEQFRSLKPEHACQTGAEIVAQKNSDVLCCSSNTSLVSETGRQRRRQIWFRIAMFLGDNLTHKNCLKFVLCEAGCRDLIKDGPREDNPEARPDDPEYLSELLESWDYGHAIAGKGDTELCRAECHDKYTGCSEWYLKPWDWILTSIHKLGMNSFDGVEWVIDKWEMIDKMFG